MKKSILVMCTAAACALSACATQTGVGTTTSSSSTSSSSASPLQSLLGGLTGSSSSSSSSSTSSSSSSSSSSLGSALSGLISGLLTTDNVELSSMVGTWKYSSPAVCFQSDNFLQKAGGSAVAGTIEDKLSTYYSAAGLTNLVLTINSDYSFTMKSGKLSSAGTVSKNSDGDILFSFQALGTVSLGSMKAYVTMTSGKQMSLMFDVSKLTTVLKTVGSVSGNSTVTGVTTLLESYDGICAGFKFNKQ